MPHTLTLKKIAPVTPDTHHLWFDCPEGLSCRPGQAFDLALDRDGWRDEARPFTPVSLPGEEAMRFVIKSYPEHDGVTEQIARMKAGDRVILGAPWGALQDEGPGWFIAGGAGITPFIAILRQRLKRQGTLAGCTLLFSNSRAEDIILREELEQMEGLKTVFCVTEDGSPGKGIVPRRIDQQFLADHIEPETGTYYVCGPDAMIDDIQDALLTLGVAEDRIVREDFG
ncbi:FAD-binding oxidoreductase [Pseudooceanicola sp. C21-150M6]|uniref:FAD-binding oxidoreductase n=1 Tax=Pseudooceanicola sp. C21-150M6 TaxID=3434355 RepID=UPI003D7FFCE1